MPSVTRDKRKYGAPTILGDTSVNRKKQAEDREWARADEMKRDRMARHQGEEFYHTGRVLPIIDDENEF